MSSCLSWQALSFVVAFKRAGWLAARTTFDPLQNSTGTAAKTDLGPTVLSIYRILLYISVVYSSWKVKLSDQGKNAYFVHFFALKIKCFRFEMIVHPLKSVWIDMSVCVSVFLSAPVMDTSLSHFLLYHFLWA